MFFFCNFEIALFSNFRALCKIMFSTIDIFQFAPEVGPTISLPNIIREGCQEDAYDMVNKNNTTEDKESVENPRVLSLISSLTSLMCILHRLADGER